MTINAGTGSGPTGTAESEAVFLRRTINELERRLAAVEMPPPPQGIATPPSVSPTPPARAASRPAPLTPTSSSSPATTWTATPPPPPSSTPPPSPTASSPGSPVPPTGYGVELARPSGPGAEALLKWSGLLLVFLAAVFLVSTAIDRGWIGPELQLAGSFAIGGALVAGGLALEDRRAGWATPLASVGITVLSMCAVAGWQWLELASPTVWLAVTAPILLAALWLTRRFDRPGVAATGIATSTVAVLWIAELAPVAAVLTAVFAGSTMAASLMVRRPSLHLTTIVTTFVAFFALAAAGDGPVAITLGAGIATAVAIWLVPVAQDRLGIAHGDTPVTILWVDASRRILIALPSLVGFAAALAARTDSHDSGLIMLAAGGVALAAAATLGLLMERSAESEPTGRSIWVSQVLGGAVAVFVAAALLLDGPALLASLIAQSAALLFFTRMVDDPFARVQAGLVTAVAGIFGLGRLLVGIDRALPLIDHVTHLALVIVIAGWSRVETGTRRTALAVTAYLGLMLWAIPSFVHLAQGQAAISTIWAALGLATLVIGSTNGSVRAIQGGLATLGVVVVKALTVDLVDVDTFWRVGLFFLLGGAFLAVSYRFGSGLGTLGGSVGEQELPEPPKRPGPRGPAPQQPPSQTMPSAAGSRETAESRGGQV